VSERDDFSAGRRPLTTSDLLTDSTPQRRDETSHDVTGTDRPWHDGGGGIADDRSDDRPADRDEGGHEHERADDAVDVDGAPRHDGSTDPDVQRHDGHHDGDAGTDEPVDRATPDTDPTDEVEPAVVPAETRTAPATGLDEALFGDDEVQGFRDRWRELQADFVDNPRQAVVQADELVAEVIQSLATTFDDRKSSLEGQWSRGDEVQTEDLRLALHQYRAFFQKLLAV
jgi:hypothetical protein